MNIYGLLGFPLIHSFSKTFFTEKFQKEHINAEYLNFEIPNIEELPHILEKYPSLKGLNVTIPYKQQVMPYLDDISEEAKGIGAVNCIRITSCNGKRHLKGYNADVIGFVHSIQPLLLPQHTQALVLGTGGASKAVCYGLKQLGLTTRLVSRTPKEGMLSYRQLTPEVMSQFKVIVNCSPVGTFPHEDTYPDIPYQLVRKEHLLYDLVYNPDKTLFLQKGEERGATIKNGLEMLHLQAIASWNFWNKTF